MPPENCENPLRETGKTLLITGFEPFDHADINASWQAVKALPEQIGEWKLVKKEIPVVFEQAAQMVLKEAEAIKADALICCGLNGKADAIHLEYLAVNLRHARIPDNSGQQPLQKRICEDGPLALESRLPVFEAEKRLKEAGIPAAVSFSAGTYVCNDVMYQILQHCQTHEIPGGFVHIPPLADLPARREEQAETEESGKANPNEAQTQIAPMSLEQAVKGLSLLVEML